MNAITAVTSLPLPSLTAGLITEPASLGAHVRACERARGRDFWLRCIGERLDELMAPRFVTTVISALALLFVAACL